VGGVIVKEKGEKLMGFGEKILDLQEEIQDNSFNQEEDFLQI